MKRRIILSSVLITFAALISTGCTYNHYSGGHGGGGFHDHYHGWHHHC